MNIPCYLLAAALALPALTSPVRAGTVPDAPGCKDLPMITRYPGSSIEYCGGKDFDDYDLIVGKCTDYDKCKMLHVEGKISHVHYQTPANRSLLEISRNYQQALSQAGFQKIYSCHAAGCGVDGGGGAHPEDMGFINGLNNRYWVGKLVRPEGDVYAVVNVDGHENGEDPNDAYVWTIEVKAMQGGKIKVDANALARSLDETGHVAVYGIYFDADSARVKSQSTEALRQIAKLLAMRPKLKVYVVGHTDFDGSFGHNMQLSRARADAVVKLLCGRYHVAAARLKPVGVGPVCPVASNMTKSGRAKNRRVELVQQ